MLRIKSIWGPFLWLQLHPHPIFLLPSREEVLCWIFVQNNDNTIVITCPGQGASLGREVGAGIQLTVRLAKSCTLLLDPLHPEEETPFPDLHKGPVQSKSSSWLETQARVTPKGKKSLDVSNSQTHP